MEKLISFIIPCYRSEETIEKVVAEITDTMSDDRGFGFEIICVNDSSPDSVWPVLKRLAEADTRIKAINFSDNSGKDAALLAGIAHSKGEYLVCLDDDCQCPANKTWDLLEPLLNNESDVTTACYAKKKQAAWKNIGSDLNLLMSRILLDQPANLRMENFIAMKRFVADEIIKYPNAFPYLEGLILRVTKRIKSVPMEERTRGDNKSSGFTLAKSIALFSNGMTAFSVKPLRVSTFAGVLFALVGMILAVVVAIKRIIGVIDIEGYSSIIIIQLIVGGLTLLSLGMIGEYIGRIYISLNKAPQYVIKDKINLD